MNNFSSEFVSPLYLSSLRTFYFSITYFSSNLFSFLSLSLSVSHSLFSFPFGILRWIDLYPQLLTTTSSPPTPLFLVLCNVLWQGGENSVCFSRDCVLNAIQHVIPTASVIYLTWVLITSISYHILRFFDYNQLIWIVFYLHSITVETWHNGLES